MDEETLATVATPDILDGSTWKLLLFGCHMWTSDCEGIDIERGHGKRQKQSFNRDVVRSGAHHAGQQLGDQNVLYNSMLSCFSWVVVRLCPSWEYTQSKASQKGLNGLSKNTAQRW